MENGANNINTLVIFRMWTEVCKLKPLLNAACAAIVVISYLLGRGVDGKRARNSYFLLIIINVNLYFMSVE